jgi:phage baseplate assembly protein gpV
MGGTFPSVCHAQVVALDPSRGFVTVQLPSLQVPGLRARLLYHGPADGLRIRQTAMPTVGTWGLVLCPYGDSRQAIWAGSLLTTMLDARTGDSDPYVEYNSHWSGYFSYLDSAGNHYEYFPDGTYVGFATSTALPSITRHTVDNTQTQQSTAFPASQRTASPVAARPYVLRHATGTQVQIDASGNATVTAASGKTITLSGNSGSMQIDSSGNIHLTGVASVNITAPTIALNGNVTQTAGTGTGSVSMIGPVTVTHDVTAAGISVQNHYHSGVTTGGGNTAAPVPGS